MIAVGYNDYFRQLTFAEGQSDKLHTEGLAMIDPKVRVGEFTMERELACDHNFNDCSNAANIRPAIINFRVWPIRGLL